MLLVGSITREYFTERLAALLTSVWTRDDVMEAAIQNHLHAAIYLGTCYMSLVDFASNTGMYARLELLSGEVSLG